MGNGVSIRYIGDRRRRAVLRRAIWDIIESDMPGEFDIEAADEVVTQLCNTVGTVVEDMKSISEFVRLGYSKRHWYVLELQISDRSVATQNTLEGAN